MDKYELRNTLSLEIPFSQLFTFNVLNEEQLSETNRWISAPEGTVLNHFQLAKATGKKKQYESRRKNCNNNTYICRTRKMSRLKSVITLV